MLSLWAKIFMGFGCIFAGLSVAIGAFAAHALKSRLDQYALNILETGVKYQFYHALALIVLGIFVNTIEAKMTIVGILFILGITLFSGSLYLLAATEFKWLGAVTPFGGLAFILAWSLWAFKMFKL